MKYDHRVVIACSGEVGSLQMKRVKTELCFLFPRWIANQTWCKVSVFVVHPTADYGPVRTQTHRFGEKHLKSMDFNAPMWLIVFRQGQGTRWGGCTQDKLQTVEYNSTFEEDCPVRPQRATNEPKAVASQLLSPHLRMHLAPSVRL